ncbi:LysM peptidoglycan-binding domain-containing protein [Pseudooceanicola atlanticus]|uniref:LysM peptidoglycan-binding domain-containing protein n=1 Tax=Pseudooceanicola atlanticus TaxID=1461694 RepID=UPI0005C16290|nr:LysM peptidoglycan-binding domain-containing protein [Pseudooceanicola atlanticus]
MNLASLGGWPGVSVAGAATVGVAVTVAYVAGVFEPEAPTPAPIAVMEQAADVAQVEAEASQGTAEPEADEVVEAAEDTATEETPEPVAAPEIDPPRFDVVRMETDGQTLVAGAGAPNADISILVDGVEAVVERAGGDGKFVAFLDLEPSASPRVLSLSMSGPDGDVVSVDEVILGPTLVAQAEAEPSTEDVTSSEPVASETSEDVAAASEATVSEPDMPAAPEATTESEMASTEAPAASDPAAPESVAEAAEPTATVEQSETAEAAGTMEPAETAEVADPPATPESVAEPSATAVASADPAVTPETETEPTSTAAPVATAEAAPVDQNTPAEQSEAAMTGEPVETAAAETPSNTAPEVGKETAPTAPDTPQVASTEPDAPAPVASVAPTDSPEEPVAMAAQAVTPVVILSSEAGVEVLQAPSPEVMDDVAIDSITYSDIGDVSLSGRGRSGGFIRIYLDDKPITVSRIAEDGRWRAELPNVDTGIYRLRVDEVDEAGTVQSRVETPFKREAPQAVADAQPTLASTVTVQPGSTLWAIARDRYGEGIAYVRVFNANKDLIRDPDLIYPGQVFTVPAAEE